MTTAPRQARTFRVHARSADGHHARVIEEASFEAAAVAYLEDFGQADAPEIQIVVREVATGHEHCFVVDLDTGETAPCG